MGYVTVYKKTCVDPKEVNFNAVAARVKMKIAPDAIDAFRQKVPAVPGKPFDVLLDWDQAMGKCRLGVKKLGSDWDFEWEDEVFKANKKKMEGVTKVMNTWDAELNKFRAQTRRKEVADLTAIVDGLEKRVASKDVRVALDPRLVEAARGRVRALGAECGKTRADCPNWWDGEPKAGVLGVMKKLGIPPETMNSTERSSAESYYAYLQKSFNQCLEECADSAKVAPALLKRLDALMVSMNANHAAVDSMKKQIDESKKALQAAIKEVQEAFASDFTELKYDETVKAAAEFKKKEGNAYAILHRNPDTMQQVLERNSQRREKSRVLGGRVETICRQWAKLPDFITRDPEIRKGLETLLGLRKEYMARLGLYQNALTTFDEGLQKALKALEKKSKK